MKLEDFSRIDPKNMGGLPLPVKAVVLAVMLMLLVGLGFWFVWQPALEELKMAQEKEVKLRETFTTKKKEAINLPAYKQQMAEIERTFGALLRQLPNKAEMDALLIDINQAGLNRGMEFELFKPGKERPAEFYAEVPVTIRVTGTYFELGGFATDLSNLSRIVALGDFTIVPLAKDKGASGRLTIDAVTKTFRYLDPSEIAPKKGKGKGAKKGGK